MKIIHFIIFFLVVQLVSGNEALTKNKCLTNLTIDEVTIYSVISNLKDYPLSDKKTSEYITQMHKNSLFKRKSVYHYKKINLKDITLSINFIIDNDFHEFNTTIRWYVVVLKDDSINNHAIIAEYESILSHNHERWRVSRFRSCNMIEIRDYEYSNIGYDTLKTFFSFLYKITDEGYIHRLERDFTDSSFFSSIPEDSLVLSHSINKEDILNLQSQFQPLKLPVKIDYQLLKKPIKGFPVDETTKLSFPSLKIRYRHNAIPTNNYSIYPIGYVDTSNSMFLIYCVEFHDFNNFRIVNLAEINKSRLRIVDTKIIAYYEKTSTNVVLRESFISEKYDLNYYDFNSKWRITISLLD
jgi:hypothetical protein